MLLIRHEIIIKTRIVVLLSSQFTFLFLLLFFLFLFLFQFLVSGALDSFKHFIKLQLCFSLLLLFALNHLMKAISRRGQIHAIAS